MSKPHRFPPALAVPAVVFIIIGLALAAGGVPLVALGGSPYYVVTGGAIALTGVLLAIRRRSALWLFAVILFGSTIWAVVEARFDFWQLLPRLWVWLVLALWLLLPPVTRKLVFGPPAAHREGVVPLAAAVLLTVLLGIVTAFNHPYDHAGTLASTAAVPAAPLPGDANRQAADWTDYGGSPLGQRYSPLTQITPENARQLKVAWQFETGDKPGPGDPTETTDENTPIKVGNKLFLCTPHSMVIALDPASGKEIWRYDPHIQSPVGFKHWEHMTCRGVSYHDDAMYPANATVASAANAAAASGSSANADTASASATAAPNAEASASASAPVADAASASTEAGTAASAATVTAEAASGVTAASEPLAAAQQTANAAASAECPRRIFLPTADARLIALNADTGQPCTHFGNNGQIDLRANIGPFTPGGYYSTSPPAVTRDLVIISGHVTDNESTNEPSGVTRAFDVHDGHLVWNWDAGNPDATQPIGANQTYVRNSPNMWSVFSVDEKLGMVYLPLGNQTPDQWGGLRTPASEKVAAGVVALDLATGKMRWNYQFTHHDLWDMDVGGQPSLIDLQTPGGVQPALIASTKQGSIYVLNRETGKPIVPITEEPVPQGAGTGDHTSPTQPFSALNFKPPKARERDMWGTNPFDQLWCRVKFKSLRYDGMFTPPSEQGSLVFPGNFGVFDWGGIAVDPVRQVLIANPSYMAFTSKLIPRSQIPSDNGDKKGSETSGIKLARGTPYGFELNAFLSPLGIPCQAPPWGYVAGVDLRTNRIVWEHKNGTIRDSAPLPIPMPLGVPSLGGMITTAGGVAFLSGTLDYYLRAYDVRTGDRLWQARLPAGGQATPMTYADSNGKQYVLVTAGGHGSLGTKQGDYVIAYTLP
ncbi:glucose/quinate/shikimate family membrane-bound PQQ-dependent dehydrogenase [Paraburkholderia rhynchosiae]|uniref:Membrane-bound PQQ-dependent dehydrogenase, glucose/quinate/shikimate family n=1 Tax=Paraburkholderia rhynchosiae TaxID=487049 RepID=A0A2N7WSS4_9BURK|nr:glucose/quinate/shikimate family membrane-bound PQQ-dependent dehydrogenase [Paraburkholderia rhynchosiae]PMS32392.1 membrane-bound PQQ-dependent dehydrogenase, glucose/quinate/shikimate family [Paraburkholderia rhynchosiae]CAB3676345.1 Outer membrane protein assembly factor BamB [Paraburkholderia rhynchosiae]